jgi:hypothetical protein
LPNSEKIGPARGFEIAKTNISDSFERTAYDLKDCMAALILPFHARATVRPEF